ncbi:MAG: hypothetical protein OWS74_02925, partial [Firmicutes bacterium]|nr:hypothetical protein [Bacillota bacterium]
MISSWIKWMGGTAVLAAAGLMLPASALAAGPPPTATQAASSAQNTAQTIYTLVYSALFTPGKPLTVQYDGYSYTMGPQTFSQPTKIQLYTAKSSSPIDGKLPVIGFRVKAINISTKSVVMNFYAPVHLVINNLPPTSSPTQT